MNGKEIPFNKSDKYIEIIHKSTFLYPHSKLFKKKTSVYFQPSRREDKKARWATYMDTTTLDTTMDTTL